MKKLSESDWRCSGRFCLSVRGEYCLEKDSCVRYLSLAFDKENGIKDYNEIPVKMAMPSCKEKISVTVENEKDYNFAIDQIAQLLSNETYQAESIKALASEIQKYERECIEATKNSINNDKKLLKTGNKFHY